MVRGKHDKPKKDHNVATAKFKDPEMSKVLDKEFQISL